MEHASLDRREDHRDWPGRVILTSSVPYTHTFLRYTTPVKTVMDQIQSEMKALEALVHAGITDMKAGLHLQPAARQRRALRSVSVASRRELVAPPLAPGQHP